MACVISRRRSRVSDASALKWNASLVVQLGLELITTGIISRTSSPHATLLTIPLLFRLDILSFTSVILSPQMMPGSDISFFKHARAASAVWVDQVPRGGSSCLPSCWNTVINELARVTGGREVVELFRNLIGTPARLPSLHSDLTHRDRHRPNKER